MAGSKCVKHSQEVLARQMADDIMTAAMLSKLSALITDSSVPYFQMTVQHLLVFNIALLQQSQPTIMSSSPADGILYVDYQSISTGRFNSLMEFYLLP